MNECFSEDLKKLANDNICHKVQEYWINEMSKMLTNTKSTYE